MFTGIIEALGKIVSLKKEGGNLHITVSSPISSGLKVDQSVAHNGVCLTVVSTDASSQTHTITAIQETLSKTNLGSVKIGDTINLERSLKVGDRLDGHIVQGHVDTTAICEKTEEQNGSKIFTFIYPESERQITVEKGSVCVNGISLTVIHSQDHRFSVAIIPYTYDNTTFKTLKAGDTVNIEFDILGKYAAKMLSRQLNMNT
ncbi:MAG: riboflavin synthase [Bacteroidetes bacterium]|nr:riboflavin synthase [Bacteroidota bacterium]